MKVIEYLTSKKIRCYIIGGQDEKDIEKMINKKVFLTTPIKVKKDRRNSSSQLKKFGYKK